MISLIVLHIYVCGETNFFKAKTNFVLILLNCNSIHFLINCTKCFVKSKLVPWSLKWRTSNCGIEGNAD